MTDTTPAPALSLREEALEVVKEWQEQLVESQTIAPTEERRETLYRVNQIVSQLEALA